MKKYKIAVITFPGMNREEEAVRAINRAGLEGVIFRWNEDPNKLTTFDGYMFPGGFSYEDRGRSGVVAAQDPVIDFVRKEATKGKPVLGVCNGAQILVETGMIPGINATHLQCALAWNERIKDGKVLGTGFYNTWVYLKNTAQQGRSAFNDFNQLLYVPIAHGEGRFTFEPALLEKLKTNDQILFQYADQNANVIKEFPTNPNGSMENIAAICNEHGNIMAMMPHPETFSNGDTIFTSLRRYLEKGITPYALDNSEPYPEVTVAEKTDYDIEFYVDLIITDNTEKTIEKAVQKRVDANLNLKRSVFWGIKSEETNLAKLATALIDSGEFLNLNKERVKVKIADKLFDYQKEKGLQERMEKIELKPYLVFEKQDFIGKAKTDEIHHFLCDQKVNQIQRGISWTILNADKSKEKNVLDSFILHNPYSMQVCF